MSAATMPTPEWADEALTSRKPEHDEVYFGRQFGDGEQVDIKIDYFADTDREGVTAAEVAIAINTEWFDGDGYTTVMSSDQAIQFAAVLVKAAAVLAPIEQALR